jgi:hypothetical protein
MRYLVVLTSCTNNESDIVIIESGCSLRQLAQDLVDHKVILYTRVYQKFIPPKKEDGPYAAGKYEESTKSIILTTSNIVSIEEKECD